MAEVAVVVVASLGRTLGVEGRGLWLVEGMVRRD